MYLTNVRHWHSFNLYVSVYRLLQIHTRATALKTAVDLEATKNTLQ